MPGVFKRRLSGTPSSRPCMTVAHRDALAIKRRLLRILGPSPCAPDAPRRGGALLRGCGAHTWPPPLKAAACSQDWPQPVRQRPGASSRPQRVGAVPCIPHTGYTRAHAHSGCVQPCVPQAGLKHHVCSACGTTSIFTCILRPGPAHHWFQCVAWSAGAHAREAASSALTTWLLVATTRVMGCRAGVTGHAAPAAR